MQTQIVEIKNDIEELARMVANGFVEMNKRFVEVDRRFDGIEGEIREIRDELRSTNRHIDQIIMPSLDSHARRIKDLELKIA